ncbi:Hypothetical predicted protein [Mytilus galloprovincialis]|nr:Hypothetical predicted protein [Mytilus galloprovincialis]
MQNDTSPFYLGINHSKKGKAVTWYKNMPIRGEGKLRTLMKTAATKANITDKKLTNHSGRRTAVTRLIEEGLPLTVVQQHTGHKNIQSLLSYQKNSLKKQKEIAHVLDGSSSESVSIQTVKVNQNKDLKVQVVPQIKTTMQKLLNLKIQQCSFHREL